MLNEWINEWEGMTGACEHAQGGWVLFLKETALGFTSLPGLHLGKSVVTVGSWQINVGE